jgi:4-hydroxybenzoate polyprenyltransferase
MEAVIIKIKAFFKLVRWFHELAVILPFLSLYFVINFFAHKNDIESLPAFDFIVLCLCVQTIIAAGCVLNDVVDRDIDKINKPITHVVGNTISLKNAWIIFYSLAVVIILLSVYISVFMFVEWIYISVGVCILSLSYDLYFKRSPLMGNVLMGLLTAFIPLILFFFASDRIAAINDQRIVVLIWLYAAFPFLIIVPRELSLDISDMEGDKACGCRTLPIVIGAKRSKQLVTLMIIGIIFLSVVVVYFFHYLLIALSLVDVMLIYYIFRLQKTETRIEYIRIGRFLWFIMLFGLAAFTISIL